MSYRIMSIDDPLHRGSIRQVHGIYLPGKQRFVRPLHGLGHEMFESRAFVEGLVHYLTQTVSPLASEAWDASVPSWLPRVLDYARLVRGYDETRDPEGSIAVELLGQAIATWQKDVREILRCTRAVPVRGSSPTLIGHRGSTAILYYRDAEGPLPILDERTIEDFRRITADDPGITFRRWIIYSGPVQQVVDAALTLPAEMERRSIGGLDDAIHHEQRERERLIEALERDLPGFTRLLYWADTTCLAGTWRGGVVAAIVPTGEGPFHAEFEDWHLAAHERAIGGHTGTLYLVSTATTLSDGGNRVFLQYGRRPEGWVPFFDDEVLRRHEDGDTGDE